MATYLAQPGEVGRVLLLYSGGLDTSVMLKWIQDEYEAEVVALTVNLGQPGEDYDVVSGKALQLGALDCHVVDAREEFAREYVLPAIQANADYGDGYPLFTALGRPLIAKLAVEYARRTGCDTIAHGCTGKGNDQVRIEGTVATLAPELKVIAPVRSWRMGRDEEIAYARKHGIPVKGGTGDGAVLDRRQPVGALVRGQVDRGPLARAGRRRVPARHAARGGARRGARSSRSTFEQGVPVALNGARMELVALVEAAAPARHEARRRDRRPHRGPDRRPQGARHLRGAGGGDPAHRPPRARAAVRDDPPEPVQAASSTASGRTSSTPGLWWEPLRTDIEAYIRHVNERVTGTIGLKLFKGSARVVTRESPNAVYDAQLATFAESGGLFSQQASPGFIELWSLQSRMAHRLRNG